MLALAPDGGRPSHRPVMSLSTATGLLRFISSIASTARCLGVPNGISAPSTLISNGPSRPNSRVLSAIPGHSDTRLATAGKLAPGRCATACRVHGALVAHFRRRARLARQRRVGGIPVTGIPPTRVGRLGELAGKLRAVGLGRPNDERGRL